MNYDNGYVIKSGSWMQDGLISLSVYICNLLFSLVELYFFILS